MALLRKSNAGYCGVEVFGVEVVPRRFSRRFVRLERRSSRRSVRAVRRAWRRSVLPERRSWRLSVRSSRRSCRRSVPVGTVGLDVVLSASASDVASTIGGTAIANAASPSIENMLRRVILVSVVSVIALSPVNLGY
jgi:hypothetical protein